MHFYLHICKKIRNFARFFMKIISFVYTERGAELVLKADSCLLNGRKPFFLPEGSDEIGYTQCLVLRVSRLGKGIALPFAHRYYDAEAYGADFTAMDRLRELQAQGRPWTQAFAFDYSLAIGEFVPVNGEQLAVNGDYVLSPDEAIVEASKQMTIRQGDLITIQKKVAPQRVEKEQVLCFEENGKERLYCKIK